MSSTTFNRIAIPVSTGLLVLSAVGFLFGGLSLIGAVLVFIAVCVIFLTFLSLISSVMKAVDAGDGRWLFDIFASTLLGGTAFVATIVVSKLYNFNKMEEWARTTSLTSNTYVIILGFILGLLVALVVITAFFWAPDSLSHADTKNRLPAYLFFPVIGIFTAGLVIAAG